MAPVTQPRATFDDLLRTEGKAELIGGRIVEFMATGEKPNLVAGNIYASLRDYSPKVGRGVCYTDNVGFAVPELSSGRESFSPDVSYHLGARPTNPMRFVPEAPTFAVEVRTECDYRAGADEAMAEKRADYFEAGTLVVWDVDTESDVVHVYRASDPDRPMTFRRGDVADAEPAAPGWRVTLDDVFWTPPV